MVFIPFFLVYLYPPDSQQFSPFSVARTARAACAAWLEDLPDRWGRGGPFVARMRGIPRDVLRLLWG